MNKTLVERVLVPIGLPLLALVVIELIVVAFSRILLAYGKNPAVFIALGAAVAILVVAALIAASPRMKSGSIIGLLVLGGVGTVAWGVVAAAQGYAPIEAHHEATEEEVGGLAHAEITAQNNAFAKNELAVPAERQVELHFVNEDAVPHNVAIYETAAAEQLIFRGETFTGPADMTYDVPAMDAGEYYFRCDVHPQMEGTLVVAEGPASGELVE